MLRAALLLVLVLVGCGGEPSASSQVTPSPIAQPAVSPSSACASASSITPPPASPGAGWPSGGAVPAELAGRWARTDLCLILTGYTYDFGAGRGNVVVKGSEIDFFNGEACGKALPDGVGRWNWVVSGNVLTFSLLAGDPCGRRLVGTYTKSL